MSENFESRYEDSFGSGFSLTLTDFPTTTICGGGATDTITCYGANDILGAFNAKRSMTRFLTDGCVAILMRIGFTTVTTKSIMASALMLS